MTWLHRRGMNQARGAVAAVQEVGTCSRTITLTSSRGGSSSSSSSSSSSRAPAAAAGMAARTRVGRAAAEGGALLHLRARLPPPCAVAGRQHMHKSFRWHQQSSMASGATASKLCMLCSEAENPPFPMHHRHRPLLTAPVAPFVFIPLSNTPQLRDDKWALESAVRWPFLGVVRLWHRGCAGIR